MGSKFYKVIILLSLELLFKKKKKRRSFLPRSQDLYLAKQILKSFAC